MFLCSYNLVVYCILVLSCILVKQRAAIVVEVFAVSVEVSLVQADVCFMPNTVHLYTKEHQ